MDVYISGHDYVATMIVKKIDVNPAKREMLLL